MARARWIGFGGALGTGALVACAGLTGADDLRVTAAGDGGLSGSSSGQTDAPVTVLPDGNVIVGDSGLTPPAPGVLCDGVSCAGHCCAAQGGAGLTAICLPANQACSSDAGAPGLAIDLYCDESADCTNGSACCSGESFTVQCRPPGECTDSFLYMCGRDSDCPPIDGGTPAGACTPVPPGEGPYPFGKGICLVDDD